VWLSVSEIFYRNISFSTNQTTLLYNVCSMDFQIICLTEILLSDISFDHKIFPDAFTNFHSYSFCNTKISDAVLRDFSRTVSTFKSRYDM
jgi:hypothetical protein